MSRANKSKQSLSLWLRAWRPHRFSPAFGHLSRRPYCWTVKSTFGCVEELLFAAAINKILSPFGTFGTRTLN
jgi:hypothetical protein